LKLIAATRNDKLKQFRKSPPDNQNMVEIKLAAVVQFGFYSSDDSEKVEQALKELYGESGETYGGVIMGTGGNWSRTHYSKDQPDDEELSKFSSISTYLAPDNRHVYDAITVGRLSRDSIDSISSADMRTAESVIDNAIDSIEAFSADVPTIPEGERAKRPTVFYVEPAEKLDIGWKEDGLDIGETTQWLEQNRDFLQRIKILLGHPSSVIGTEDILSPHSTGAGFIRRVTMLNTSSTYDTDRDSKTGPIWLRRIEGALKSYYRSDCWLNYRLIQIGEIDSQTHGTREILSKEGSDLDYYQSTEKDLEAIRRDWIDVYTKVSDEVEELISDTPTMDEETLCPQREIPIPPPESHQESPQSLYELYDDHVEELQDSVQKDLDRVGKKLDRLSQFIHDSVTARASETNIQLQKDVTELTRILTWLTVLLALLGIIRFGMAVAPSVL
jgi:hypothetical protein